MSANQLHINFRKISCSFYFNTNSELAKQFEQLKKTYEFLIYTLDLCTLLEDLSQIATFKSRI